MSKVDELEIKVEYALERIGKLEKSQEKSDDKQIKMDRDIHIDRVAVGSISAVLLAVFGEKFLKIMGG